MDKNVIVGMELTVRKDLMDFIGTGNLDMLSGVVGEMGEMAGMTVTVSEIYDNDRFKLTEDLDKWMWNKIMFEEFIIK